MVCDNDRNFAKTIVGKFHDDAAIIQMGGGAYSYGYAWIRAFIEGKLPERMARQGWTNLRAEFDEEWNPKPCPPDDWPGSELPF